MDRLECLDLDRVLSKSLRALTLKVRDGVDDSDVDLLLVDWADLLVSKRPDRSDVLEIELVLVEMA